MNKKILLFFLSFILTGISYSENIEIYLIATGNYNGNYDKLGSIEGRVKSAGNYYKSIVNINTGNNISSNRIKNELLYNFYKNNSFDFNFLGKKELSVAEYVEKSIYSSVNIFHKSIIPYKIVKREGYSIGIIGITDGYDISGAKTLDYKLEIKKAVYRMGIEVDFIFAVSDMTRAENINIMKEFPEISVIFESGYERVDEMPLKLNYGYIVPSSEGVVMEMVYNEKISKKWNKKTKSVFIRSYEKLEKFKSDGEKEAPIGEFENNKKIEEQMNEIVGYNSIGFYREEATFTTNIDFVNSTARNIMRYYDADVVLMPGSNLKKDLKKGFYRRKDIEEIFSKDKLQICMLSAKDLSEIEKRTMNSKGEEGYIYIVRSPKKIFKNIYKAIIIENSKEYLKGITYEEIFTANLNVNNFVPRGNYEEK
jgi:hypothetical protein